MSTPVNQPSDPGLTAAGAIVIAVGLGLVGGVIDVVTGSGLGTVFSVCFVAGCALAAVLARRSALRATVVMPPLVYLLVTVVAAGVEATGTGSSWLNQQVLEAGTSLVIHAPTLVIAVLVAVVVAAVRNAAAKQAGSPVARRVPHRPASRG